MNNVFLDSVEFDNANNVDDVLHTFITLHSE